MTRPAATTGNHPLPASRGVTQYYADNLIPFPPHSILAADAPLEPLNLAKARFYETLLFALFLNFIAWGVLALCFWALFF